MKLHASLLVAALLAAFALDASAQAQPAAQAAPAPAAAAAAAQPAGPNAAEGEKRYAAVCAACHAADGNSTIAANPKLAQQHPEYLVKQLHDFKDKKRASAIMQPFAAQLADQDMRNISAFLAAAKAKPGFARDK